MGMAPTAKPALSIHFGVVLRQATGPVSPTRLHLVSHQHQERAPKLLVLAPEMQRRVVDSASDDTTFCQLLQHVMAGKPEKQPAEGRPAKKTGDMASIRSTGGGPTDGRMTGGRTTGSDTTLNSTTSDGTTWGGTTGDGTAGSGRTGNMAGSRTNGGEPTASNGKTTASGATGGGTTGEWKTVDGIHGRRGGRVQDDQHHS